MLCTLISSLELGLYQTTSLKHNNLIYWHESLSNLKYLSSKCHLSDLLEMGVCTVWGIIMHFQIFFSVELCSFIFRRNVGGLWEAKSNQNPESCTKQQNCLLRNEKAEFLRKLQLISNKMHDTKYLEDIFLKEDSHFWWTMTKKEHTAYEIPQPYFHLSL